MSGPAGDVRGQQMPKMTFHVNDSSQRFVANGWSLNTAKAQLPRGSFNNTTGPGPMSLLASEGSKMNTLGSELMATQTQYNLRANITRLVVPILLPEPVGVPGSRYVYRTFVAGDVVFALRVTNAMLNAGMATTSRHAHPQQVFSINLQTLNYILVNFQEAMRLCQDRDALNEEMKRSCLSWFNYVDCLMGNDAKDGVNDQHILPQDSWHAEVYMKQAMWRFVKKFVRLAGVYIGSEEQGGQHQGANNPRSHNPTDFVGTLQTMGKYEKTRNLWTTSTRGVSNGDLLGFTLKQCKKPTGSTASRPMRMSLSGNPSSPQVVNIQISSEPFILVPEIYDRMLASPMSELTTVLSESTAGDLSESVAKQMLCVLSPGIAVHGGYFMQFAVVNEMSKGLTGTKDTQLYALDATACTITMNTEVLLRFTVGEPPRVASVPDTKRKPTQNKEKRSHGEKKQKLTAGQLPQRTVHARLQGSASSTKTEEDPEKKI